MESGGSRAVAGTIQFKRAYEAPETGDGVRVLVDRLWPRDPDSPIYALRASHRGEHLDDVEAALRDPSGPKGGAPTI